MFVSRIHRLKLGRGSQGTQHGHQIEWGAQNLSNQEKCYFIAMFLKSQMNAETIPDEHNINVLNRGRVRPCTSLTVSYSGPVRFCLLTTLHSNIIYLDYRSFAPHPCEVLGRAECLTCLTPVLAPGLCYFHICELLLA